MLGKLPNGNFLQKSEGLTRRFYEECLRNEKLIRIFAGENKTNHYMKMKKVYLFMLAASLSMTALAQQKQKFELGKPNNDAYRYLDEYKALKEYIDYEKYPNFKLGAGTTVNDYLNKSLVKNMINQNFSETVAGNAMKMASCVDGNGNMNFTTVKKYVKAATEAGINVYGHTLGWHSQQPKGWLLKLLADKPDPNGGEEVWTVIASKDFKKDKSVGWKSDETQFGYKLNFSSTDGLNIHCTKKNTNSWDVQFLAMTDIMTTTGKTYKMTMTVKGTSAGNLHSKLGDWGGGAGAEIPFTTEWEDVEIDYKATMGSCFFMLQCGDFVGDIYIKNIKFEGYESKTIPQTAEEMHDTLVYAMDLWIKGMMEACEGKVKGWDLVNEAISGGGNDGQGNYLLQHSAAYNPDGNPDATWDVGGDNFYWQDYMGDLEYVRQACRLARKYGPEDVKLFINDYNLEGTWDLQTKDGIKASKKLHSLVNWIKKWEADGVTKIDGIGTQMHISFNKNTNTQNGLKAAITGMFQLMAKSGKLVRVSEMDMGYNDANGQSVATSKMTEAQHKEMANFYEWIIKEYFRLIPPEQQWGICQWCTNDSPSNSGWRANTPVGIWDLDSYRKHVYAGFVRGLYGSDPTAIESVKADEAIDTSKGIYNLNGMRMSATSLDELPSGLYIVNGKKVVK
jgi:GH35 family endo-1,4-beta-xylanase